MSKGIFITGTGTDIGKTYVSGLIAKRLSDAGLNTAYYKAAMSGNERDEEGHLVPGDALSVKKASGISQPLEEMCPYVYEAAYSPHLASRIEGPLIDMNVVKDGYECLKTSYDYITVEGSGGIVCPIRHEDGGQDNVLLEDVISMLDLPCLIVADAGLGTINSVVLTAEYMTRRNIPVCGMIFNNRHPESLLEEDNMIMCEKITGIRVIAEILPGATDFPMDAAKLSSLYR